MCVAHNHAESAEVAVAKTGQAAKMVVAAAISGNAARGAENQIRQVAL